MSNQKIMLFFEDNINMSISNQKNFVDMIISRLTSKYNISQKFGKFGTNGTILEKKLYFADNNKFTEESCMFPEMELKNKNIRDITTLMPGMEVDEIPFFILDTDGIEISNFSEKILGLDYGGKQNKKPARLSGIGDLLPDLIETIYDKHIFSDNPKWGLVLVNPNYEGSYIKSINKNNINFDDIIFGEPNHQGKYLYSLLQISYWNQKSDDMRFLAAPQSIDSLTDLGSFDLMTLKRFSLMSNEPNHKHPKRKIGNAIQSQIKVIWNKLKVLEPQIFDDGISFDITSHYKLIIDNIVENPDFANLVNNNKYENAKNSVFSIYLKKRKRKKLTSINPGDPKYEKHPDYPHGLPDNNLRITNLGVSNNFEIKEFEFG